MADVTSNLQLWCKYNGNSLDSSGNNRNGTIWNNPSYTESGVDLELSSTQFIQYTPTLGIDNVSAISFYLLLRPESLSDFQILASKQASNTFRSTLHTGGSGQGSNANWVAQLCNNNTSFGRTTSNPVEAGVDLAVAMVFDGSLTGNSNRLKVYTWKASTGVVAETLTFSGTVPATTAANTTTAFRIGNASTFYFDGLIKEARVYSRAITQDDFTALVALGDSAVDEVGNPDRGPIYSPIFSSVLAPVFSPMRVS